MELFCPPTNTPPSTIDTTGIHICKSKAYNGEKYLMPRIGSAKVKKILKEEYEINNDLFDLDYKGKGVCLRYYPIEESYLIRIEAGIVFKNDGNINTPVQDTRTLEKICSYFNVDNTSQLKDIKQMRLFILTETKSFDRPKRTKNKNNSYSTEFYFKELVSDILPTGDEKIR